MKITHVYMLVGDGWIYPGRHLHLNRRYLEHLSGKCRTTAPRIEADKAPPIMVPMEGYDFDLHDETSPNGEAQLLDDLLAGKYLPDGYEVLCAVYPYYSEEATAGVNETFRKAGYPNLIRATEKSVEARRKAGFPNMARGRETQRKMGHPELKKGLEIQRRAGYPGLKKGRETQRKMGYPTLLKGRIGNHARWHVNRGMVNPDCELCADHQL